MKRKNKYICSNCKREIDSDDVFQPNPAFKLFFCATPQKNGHFCYDRFWRGHIRRLLGERVSSNSSEENERRSDYVPMERLLSSVEDLIIPRPIAEFLNSSAMGRVPHR